MTKAILCEMREAILYKMREATLCEMREAIALRDQRGDRASTDNAQEPPFPNWQANDQAHWTQITFATQVTSLRRSGAATG